MAGITIRKEVKFLDEKNLCYRDGDHMVCVCPSGQKFLYDFEDHDLVKKHSWYKSGRNSIYA